MFFFFHLNLVQIFRKLASAYINTGEIKNADKNLREALEKLGISIPLNSTKKGKIKTNTWKFTKSTTSVPSDELAHRKREAVIMLLNLAVLNYYSCNNDTTSFCADAAVALGGSQKK